MLTTAILRPPARASARSGAVVPLALATAGLGLAAISVATPWITVFRGLESLPGIVLEGGALAGILLAAAGCLAIAVTLGANGALRALAFAMTLGVAIEAAVLQLRIGAFVADPGPAGPLTQPIAGNGAGVLALGAMLILAAAVTLPARATRLTGREIGRVVMAAGLLLTGWIHLLLVPEHLGESTVLGLGFLASGIAQVVLAGVVLWRPRSWNLTLVIAINATLIAVYAYAVLVGLPFGDHAEHAEAVGLVIGSGEPIDAYGALSKLAELASAAIAFVLLAPASPRAVNDRAA